MPAGVLLAPSELCTWGVNTGPSPCRLVHDRVEGVRRADVASCMLSAHGLCALYASLWTSLYSGRRCVTAGGARVGRGPWPRAGRTRQLPWREQPKRASARPTPAAPRLVLRADCVCISHLYLYKYASTPTLRVRPHTHAVTLNNTKHSLRFSVRSASLALTTVITTANAKQSPHQIGCGWLDARHRQRRPA